LQVLKLWLQTNPNAAATAEALARSENYQAATLRGLLVQLSKDYWLQLMRTQSTAKGGRPQERWAVNPKAPESFRQLYA
jgi:hypothetical protein